MQKLTSEAVLSFVTNKGPCLPNDIKKSLGSDTMIIGAVLSELVHNKKVFVSSLKVGGSPLYYVRGQESRLQEYSKYLNEKDRAAFSLLQEKKVLQDSSLTPLMRVSLRTIRDFARPVEVNAGARKELFWKWHLLSNDTASDLIRKTLGMKSRPVQNAADTKVSAPTQLSEKQTSLNKENMKTMAKTEQTISTITDKSEKKSEKRDAKEESSEFLEELNDYFSKNKIEVLDTQVIKKNSEIDFIIRIPSPVGSLRYYCKARAKKKVNHGDLSSAYVKGESKKLPVLFLLKGDLVKKAESALAEEFQNMSLQRL